MECELSPNKLIQLHGEMGMSDELVGHDVKRILAINAQLDDRAYHLMCDA